MRPTVSASAPALAPQQEEKDDDGAENVYESIGTIFMRPGKTQASVEMSDDEDVFEV